MTTFNPNLQSDSVAADARRELTDAEAKGDAALAAWARKYGVGALDAVDDLKRGRRQY